MKTPCHDFIRETVEGTEKFIPNLAQAMFSRIFENVGQWHSYKHLLAPLCAELGHPKNSNRRIDSLDAADHDDLLWMLGQEVYRSTPPIYFLSRDWLESVSRTNLERIVIDTDRLPANTGIFVFPRDFVSGGSEIFGFVWTRVVFEKDGDGRKGAAYLGLSVVEEPNEIYASVFNVESGEELADVEFVKKVTGCNLSVAQVEREKANLFLKICLAMLARPEFVEPGRKVKMHKASGREIWTPNIIGRKYTIRRECQGGSHASPRMHWRRGHFRTQRFGLGLSESKTIWIEPVLVAGAERTVAA